MIVKPYREGSTTYMLAMRNVINKDIKTKLTSFSNVSFVESYVINSETGQTRYIFEIDGIDDYYLAFENYSDCYLYMALLLKSDSHVDLDSAVKYNSIYADSDLYPAAQYVSLKFYYIVENNKLRAIGMSDLTSTPELFMVFDGDYVCYSNYVYGPNSIAGILSNGNGTPSYSEIEKAIFRNCMADRSGLFMTIFENIFQIINNQFSAMGIACVSVEGVKYRQVCDGSVFVRDGEEE